MTETTKEVAKATSQEAMSPEDMAIEEQLRAGSGESDQAGSYTFIPYLTIDNSKVTAKLEGGGEAEVLCPPMFLLNEKDGDEYTSTPLVADFRAVVLAVRHYTQRKYLQGTDGNCANELNFYKSLEFKSFKSIVHVRQDQKFLAPMSYQQVKNMSPEGKENELWGVAYVLIEGEDTVRKVEVKGASRGALFDYVTLKKDTSISATITHFSQVVEKGDAFSYNMLKVENTNERPADLAGILKAQTELNAILDGQEAPSQPATQGEVMPGTATIQDDGTLKVEGGSPEDEIANKGLEKMFE